MSSHNFNLQSGTESLSVKDRVDSWTQSVLLPRLNQGRDRPQALYKWKQLNFCTTNCGIISSLRLSLSHSCLVHWIHVVFTNRTRNNRSHQYMNEMNLFSLFQSGSGICSRTGSCWRIRGQTRARGTWYQRKTWTKPFVLLCAGQNSFCLFSYSLDDGETAASAENCCSNTSADLNLPLPLLSFSLKWLLKTSHSTKSPSLRCQWVVGRLLTFC